MSMPTLSVSIDKKDLDDWNINRIQIGAKDHAEMVRRVNRIVKDVLTGRLVHVQKRTPIKPIDKDSFSDEIAKEKTKLERLPPQNSPGER
jgi:Txe/YoeB family toxin of Txe-Axe toxin-antitoxin module